MTRFTKILVLSIAGLFAFTLVASAALFDTIDSVDTLKTVAAKNQKTDRMPAVKVTGTTDKTTQPDTTEKTTAE